MATKIGQFVQFTFGGVKLLGELSGNLASAISTIDVSSKVDGKETKLEYGAHVAETGSASSVGSSDPADTAFGYKQAKAAQYAGTKIAVVVTEYDAAGAEVEGALKVTGTALITNVSWDIPEDAMGLSIDFAFDGKTDDSVNTAG